MNLIPGLQAERERAIRRGDTRRLAAVDEQLELLGVRRPRKKTAKKTARRQSAPERADLPPAPENTAAETPSHPSDGGSE